MQGEDELVSEKLDQLRSKGKQIDEEWIDAISSIDLSENDKLEKESISSRIAKAKALEAKEQFDLAASLYESLGFENSFNEEAVEASVDYFNGPGENMQKSYDILLKGIEINRYSKKLITLYIDQCFKMNLFNYAESVVLRLLDVMSKKEFAKYEVAFDERKRELQMSNGDW